MIQCDTSREQFSSRSTTSSGADARPLAFSAAYLLLGQVTTTAIAVALTGAIGRTLGPSNFGTWYVLSAIASFGYVFVDWGYSPYLIREVARRADRAGELTGTVLVLRGATAVIVAVLAIATTWALGYGSTVRVLAPVNIIASMPMLLLTSFTWTFRGRERMDLEALTNVVLKILIAGATFVLLLAGVRLGGVIAAQAIGGAGAFAVALALYRRVQLAPLRFNAATARELVRSAAPMFTLGLMIAVQPYVDATLLSRLVPSEVVGWYAASAVFSGTLIAPAIILGSSVYPRLSRAANNPAEFRALVRAAMRPMLLLAMLGSVGTFCFAEFAVATVYHRSNFAPAATILRLYSWNLFLISVDILLGNVILAGGSIARLAKAKILTIVVTTTLEWMFIRFFQVRFGNGAIGTTVALGAGELVTIAASLWLVPKGTLDRSVLLNFVRAALTGGATIATFRIIGAMPPLAAIPLVVGAYIAFAAAFGLITAADIAHVRQLASRARVRGLASTRHASTPARLHIGHIAVDVLTKDQTLDAIESLVDGGRGGAVFTPNVDHVVGADTNIAMREAYSRASLSVADGMPLVWASPLLGRRLPERVAGSDLFMPLMERAARRGWRVFLVGGAPGVAQQAAVRLRQELGVNVVGASSPVVDRNGIEADDCAAEEVRAARPHLVVVALGNPKQELWISRAEEALGPAVALAFGAVLDFLVGRQKRAPQWIANSGFEWLYRLSREPRRLWRRYLVQNPRFALIVARTWWHARRRNPVRTVTING